MSEEGQWMDLRFVGKQPIMFKGVSVDAIYPWTDLGNSLSFSTVYLGIIIVELKKENSLQAQLLLQ